MRRQIHIPRRAIEAGALASDKIPHDLYPPLMPPPISLTGGGAVCTNLGDEVLLATYLRPSLSFFINTPEAACLQTDMNRRSSSSGAVSFPAALHPARRDGSVGDDMHHIVARRACLGDCITRVPEPELGGRSPRTVSAVGTACGRCRNQPERLPGRQLPGCLPSR